MIELSIFIEYCNENKDKILIPDHKTYPINTKNLEKWKTLMSTLPDTYNIKPSDIPTIFETQHLNRLLAIHHKVTEVEAEAGAEAEAKVEVDIEQEAHVLFAEVFSKFLRHISFKEMYSKIGTIVEEMLQLHLEKKYHKIYFFIDGASYKSNTWIALLFTHYLSHFRTKHDNALINDFISKGFVSNNLKSIEEEYESIKESDKNILVLHLDDMSFSGSQMLDVLYDCRTGPLLNGEYNCDYYLGVAYISQAAINKFNSVELNVYKHSDDEESSEADCGEDDDNDEESDEESSEADWGDDDDDDNDGKWPDDPYAKYEDKKKQKQIQIFINTEIIDSFMNKVDLYLDDLDIELRNIQITEERPMQALLKDIEKYLKEEICYNDGKDKSTQCTHSLTAIYFDHKVADALSVFNKLLYFGSLPNRHPLECLTIPLITNCEKNPFLKKVSSSAGISYFKPNPYSTEEIEYPINLEKHAYLINDIKTPPGTRTIKATHCSEKIFDFDQENTCPKTWYKFINYTFKGQNIPPHQKIVNYILSILENPDLLGGGNYNIIYNPISKNFVKLNSNIGKKILNNYIKLYINQ